MPRAAVLVVSEKSSVIQLIANFFVVGTYVVLDSLQSYYKNESRSSGRTAAAHGPNEKHTQPDTATSVETSGRALMGRGRGAIRC